MSYLGLSSANSMFDWWIQCSQPLSHAFIRFISRYQSWYWTLRLSFMVTPRTKWLQEYWITLPTANCPHLWMEFSCPRISWWTMEFTKSHHPLLLATFYASFWYSISYSSGLERVILIYNWPSHVFSSFDYEVIWRTQSYLVDFHLAFWHPLFVFDWADFLDLMASLASQNDCSYLLFQALAFHLQMCLGLLMFSWLDLDFESDYSIDLYLVGKS